MSGEYELFDCLPELKGAGGEALGVASVVLRRATFADGSLYLHMVTVQGGSELSDLALVSGEESDKLPVSDSREEFHGTYAALAFGMTGQWKMSQLLERNLTLNEDTSPVVFKFPNQREITFFSVTVAAATALLRPVAQRNLLLAQLLAPGRRLADDEAAETDREFTLTATSLYEFDAQSLDMGKTHIYSRDPPVARLTAEWLSSEASAQAGFLINLFSCEGNEVLIALSDEMLRGHWHKLEMLIDTGDGRSAVGNGSFATRGSQGGGTESGVVGVNKIYVIGVKVTNIMGAAEAQKLRLRSKLQQTGAMSLGVNAAEMQRVRSSSLRRSLPPQHDSPASKDTSLSDEITRARANMKHVDEGEMRSRGSSLAPANTSPPLHPAPATAAKAPAEQKATKVSPPPPAASKEQRDPEVAGLTGNKRAIRSTPTAAQPIVPQQEEVNTANSSFSDVCVSPVTVMRFDNKRSPVTPVEASSSFREAPSAPSFPIIGDESYTGEPTRQKKKKARKVAEADISETEAAAVTEPTVEAADDVGTEEVSSQQPEEEVEITYEELVRQAAKLKKKKAKLEVFEVQLGEMEGEIHRRAAIMATEQSELADERQRLEHLRAIVEAQQHQHQMEIARGTGSTAINIPQPGRESISARPSATNRRNANQTKMAQEQQPLLNLHGDPDQYVFRVSTEFYDSKDLPPGLWRRMPITSAFVRWTSLCPYTALVTLIGLATSLALLAWRVGEGETHLWPMLMALAACGVLVVTHAKGMNTFMDLYHAVDQSMNNNSGTSDASPLGYEWSPMTATIIAFTVLCFFGSIGCVAYDDSPAAIAGLVLGIASISLGVGSVLANLSLMTHVLWYRVASTIPRQHGALFTRISIRAATARYQYAKQLVEVGSRRFSPTVLQVVATGLLGLGFSPYYMFIVNDSQGGHLAGAISFTASAGVLFVLVLLLSSWEGATKQVIGNLGVQADRWVRGDYNSESDARLEDYVSAQQLLVNHVMSGEYARWTIDFVPFLHEAKVSDVVPSDFRNVVISWQYRIVALGLLLLGIVMIPIVASHVGSL